ncbi:uncharacterized protein A1O9_07137 [Exophiala aquamarina CBS 119918]|uniref:BZIP domain-containing protein n=1 Tax=Exophiala aquamarina CBS 119918 TaxID=1182545 RepID=A0A072PB07_9EURO|nr:uncharacterized protein A1O9_07137 [Exophiala aquamarina CBS 119918]KEF56947.1 hypothetical protein A1O9_07137 [Exophiala aquamarina CBS 119918]
MAASMDHPPAEYHYGERTYTSLQSIISDPTQLLINSSVGMNRSSIGGDLEILSAARYPQALMEPYEGTDLPPRKRKSDPSQYYGGIVLNSSAVDGDNSSSGETDQAPPSKKKRSGKQPTAGDHEDPADSKKQRGRPRLDTQDETAADRRRTQIRLAQRAYRHRKETTISALKNKVAALEDTIDQMNKTFLDLHDNMVDAGILTSHYTLGRQLKSATEAFVAFSKVTATESDDEDEKIAKITNGESDPPDVAAKVKRTNSQDVNKWTGRDATKQPSSRTTTRANVRGTSVNPSSTDLEAVEEIPLALSKKNIASAAADDDDGFFAAISQTSFIDTSNLHGLNELMQFNAQISDHIPSFADTELNDSQSIERPIKPAHQPQGSYTYSFQETTFARRLHRMCLERAFRNLTNPHIDPSYIKRAFRFTFCFSNRKRMLQRFQEMLKRRAGESLENWSVPFFRIGGAGTHFPRRDDEGKPLYPPNMVSPAKAFGPQPWVEVETPRLEATTQEMLENIGFGGEWYDSHDVEEYLKTKGIFLDGQSSFIGVDPSVLLLIKSSTGNGNSSVSDSSSITRSPHELNIRTPSPLLDSLTDPFIARELNDIYANPSSLFPANAKSSSNTATATANTPNPITTGSEGKSHTGIAPFDAGNSSLSPSWPNNFFAPQLSADYTPGNMYPDFLGRSAQGPVTFDVDMFLERLIEHSACLGRAPGFRKSAIDEALRMSVQESAY